MVLSPPQVEPWRAKQGAEAMDSWRGNFIERIYLLLMISSFISRACRDEMGLVHLEKADRDVQQSWEAEACDLLQAIVEQTMVWWWTYYNQELFSLGSKCFIFHIVLYVLSILSRVQKIPITVWCSLLQSVASSAGLAVDFPGSRYQWREYYLMCFSGPHYAACGRRRMSSSARHKQRFVLPG